MSSRPFLETRGAAGRDTAALSLARTGRSETTSVLRPREGPRGCAEEPGWLRRAHAHLPSAAPPFHAGPHLRRLLQAASRPGSQGRMLSALGCLRGSPRPRGQGLGKLLGGGHLSRVHYFWPEAHPGRPERRHVPWIPHPAAPPVLPATAVSPPAGGSGLLPSGCLRGHAPESLPPSASGLSEHRSWLRTPLLDGPCLREGSVVPAVTAWFIFGRQRQAVPAPLRSAGGPTCSQHTPGSPARPAGGCGWPRRTAGRRAVQRSLRRVHSTRWPAR